MKYRIVQDGNAFYFVQRKKSWNKWEHISLAFNNLKDAEYIFNSYIFTVIKQS